MTNLNFPTNPTIGQTHVVGSKTYIWSGNAWLVYFNNNISATSATFSVAAITGNNDSDNTQTGALVVTGGVGVGGDLYVGGVLSVAGAIILTTSSFNVEVSEGNDIDITVDPLNSNMVIFSNISTLQTVTDRGFTTTNRIFVANNTESTSTISGAFTSNGGIGIGGNGWFEGRVNCESVKIEDAVFDSTPVTVTTNGTSVIDTYSLSQFRAAKYFVQITDSTGPSAKFQAQEITVIADNTGTAYISTYGLVSNNGPSGLGTFDAIVDGTDVKLRFTPDYATTKVIKVLRTAMTV